MVNKLDSKIVVNEFDLHSRYYVHFGINTLWEGMNCFIPSTKNKIVLRLFFYRDVFGTRYSTEVDMPLNKETKHYFRFLTEPTNVVHELWKDFRESF